MPESSPRTETVYVMRCLATYGDDPEPFWTDCSDEQDEPHKAKPWDPDSAAMGGNKPCGEPILFRRTRVITDSPLPAAA